MLLECIMSCLCGPVRGIPIHSLYPFSPFDANNNLLNANYLSIYRLLPYLGIPREPRSQVPTRTRTSPSHSSFQLYPVTLVVNPLITALFYLYTVSLDWYTSIHRYAGWRSPNVVGGLSQSRLLYRRFLSALAPEPCMHLAIPTHVTLVYWKICAGWLKSLATGADCQNSQGKDFN